MGSCNLLSFLCQEERDKYYYVIIAKGNFRLTYLDNTCNLVKVHVRFVYLTVFNAVNTGDTSAVIKSWIIKGQSLSKTLPLFYYPAILSST